MNNKNNNKEDVLRKFIVRRAFRCGAVSRADLLKAADISTATATRTIANTIARHGDILERKGHYIRPKPLAKCPDYALEEDLLLTLNCGKNNAIDTGFFDKELPITYVSWTNSMPQQSGILLTILNAIRKNKQLDIIYLGLRFTEVPKSRKILPLGLEKMNDQWRVIAQDLETQEFLVKVFVLPRILAAKTSETLIRIPFIKGHVDSSDKIKVILNHKYNSQQKQMMEHELKISNGTIDVTKRSLHEFKRRFINIPVSNDVVWPPLILKEKD